MVDPLDPSIPDPPRSPFLSLLHWLDRPGEATRALLSGKPGLAGRQLLDFVDQPLTLGLAPNATRPDEEIHWGGNAGTQALTDVATNPLSLLSLKDHHILQHAGAGIKATAKAVGGDRGEKFVDKSATGIRRTLGWLDMTDDQRDLLSRAKAAGGTASKVGQMEVERALGSLPTEERTAVGEILHGIDKSAPDRKDWRVMAGDVPTRAEGLLAARPHLNAPRVRQAVKDYQDFAKTQFDEGVRKGVFHARGDGAQDYLPRQFSGIKLGEEQDSFGRPSAVRGRKLAGPADVLGLLQEHPDVNLEFDALKAASKRAEQQGTLEKKALLLREHAGPDANIVDHNSAMKEIIEHAKKDSPDYGYALDNIYHGIAPRDGMFFKGLHAASKLFKPAATYGVVIPRVSFPVRNQLSQLWQTGSDKDGIKVLPQQIARSLPNLLGAFDDGFMAVTGSRLTKGELTSKLDLMEQAMKAAKGNTSQAFAEINKIDPLLGEALKHGVLDGWVSSEEMIKSVARTPGWKKWHSIFDLPATISQGLEQRMRAGTFMDLRKLEKPLDAAAAAKAVRETSYDYDIAGKANRNFRDIIPFGAYAAGAIKQQGKLLARFPALAIALGSVMGDHQGLPKYDWMQQQTSIPVGLDEQKNPEYITGLGLPFESLNDIPGPSGASLEHLIGQSHPLLKTAYAMTAGHDPEFGTQTGSYDRDPLTHGHSEVGRVYNELASTGLLQPVDAGLRQVGLWTDPRKSTLEKTLQFGTGLRFASVDPELAEQEQLRDVLGADPSVFKHEDFSSDDPATKALIKEMEKSRHRLKEKREALGALSP